LLRLSPSEPGRRRRVGIAGVALCFAFASFIGVAAGGEAPVRPAGGAAPKKAPPPREIVFGAEEQTLDPGPPPRYMLRGAISIESDGVRIEARAAVLNLKTGDVYAEGPVAFYDDARDARLTCESLAYNIRTHRGRAEGARLVLKLPRAPGSKGRIDRGEVETVVVESAVITREGSGRFVAEDAFVTSCGFREPHWRLSARRVEAVPGDSVTVRGAALRMGRVPVLRLPRYTMDLTEGARHMHIDAEAGSSGLWGTHARLELGFPVTRDPARPVDVDMWGFAVGWREERGWEAGLTLDWKGDEAEGRARADAFFEDTISPAEDGERATRDRGGVATKVDPAAPVADASAWLAGRRSDPVITGLDAAAVPLTEFLRAGERRHYVEVVHRARLNDPWELEAQVHAASDRDVRSEYFERDAKTGLPDATFIDLRRRSGGAYFSLFASPRVNEFATETEYSPEARFTASAVDLGRGFLLTSEASAGYLARRYDEMLDLTSSPRTDYEAFRARTRLVLSRPFRLGPLRFSPFVGTDQALYSYDDADAAFTERGMSIQNSFVRGAAVYGGAISTRLFGRLRGGERPLRHVIEMRAEYLGVSAPTHDPAEMLGFDTVDDLIESSRVRLRLDQRLQTKSELLDGSRRSRDIAGLLLETEYITDDTERGNLNSGEPWAPLRAAAFVRPSVNFSVYAAAEVDLSGEGLMTSEAGFEVGTDLSLMDDPTKTYWRASVSHVWTEAPSSSELGGRLRLFPAGRWSLELSGRYELGDRLGRPDWTDERLSIIRDFHDWDVAIGFWRDPQRDDSGLSFSIRPKGYPLNLPPMMP
jgi:hypothetical protein